MPQQGALCGQMYQAQEGRRVKKLVTVSATSASVTEASKEATLERVPCIRYPVRFRKYQVDDTQALIDSGSEVNAMHPAYAKKGYQNYTTWEIKGKHE